MGRIKEFVKQTPVLSALCRPPIRLWRQARMFAIAWRRGSLFWSLRSRAFTREIKQQAFLEYVVPDAAGDLIAFLTASGLKYNEGAWAIYLPPQEGLRRRLPFLSEYSAGAGLKILKSPGNPSEARYFSEKSAASHPFAHGTTPELIRVANYLHKHAIGPDLYDVAALRCVDRVWTTYIVEHVPHDTLQPGDYDRFRTSLGELLDRNEVAPLLQHWESSADFQPPDCNGNLLRHTTSGDLRYVDFQAFVLSNESALLKRTLNEIGDIVHFGQTSALLGGRFLYQSVPGMKHGKRDTSDRWSGIQQLLTQHAVDLEGRVVFDICCNSGMMLGCCLNQGAFWGIGWDLPVVAATARTLQSVLGMTRVTILSEEISPRTDFLAGVPAFLRERKNGLLLYLAASEHIGFPDGVAALPWSTMIYEGHAGESAAQTLEMFGTVDWLAAATVEQIDTNALEIGTQRVVMLLKR